MANTLILMPVRARPYYHQNRAFDFACRKFGLLQGDDFSPGVALLMEMGTGKTITSIGIAGALYQFGKVNKILVVAPLSILGVWEEEFKRFADFPFTLTVLKGTSSKKKELLSSLKKHGLQIVVVNYESAWRLEKEILAFDADLIIADEAHKLKEARTAQSKAMHRFGDKARYKLLLTGTVITNRELDVFSQYRFLNRRVFGDSFYVFRNRYFDMVGYGNHTPQFRTYMLDEFLQRMHSVAFRVTKDECLDLPKITEEVRTVELEPKTMKIYKELQKESYTELADKEVSAVNILTKLLRLSQVTGGHLTDDEGDCNAVSTAKLDALSDIIDSAVAEEKKIVVMARFVPELNDIESMLQKKGIGYAAVRGGVKNREEEIRRFQEDTDCRVFIGQIAAAGLGITLTSASTMVFYSLDYSMSNFEQAKARIHRVSQTENCHYIYLVAKDTVDIKVLEALRKKVDLAKALVDDYRKGIKDYLFKTQSLPVLKTTASSNEAADDMTMVLLKEWCDENKPELSHIFLLVQEFRKWGKIKSTYIDGYSKFINEATGCIHPDLFSLSTDTGRMNCRNPNAQNMPRKTNDPVGVRNFIKAPDGQIILSLDFSQIELRVGAFYCRDEVMMDTYRRGGDIHAATTSVIFGCTYEEAQDKHRPEYKEQRTIAKNVNFGTFYGLFPRGLQKTLKFKAGVEKTEQECADIIDSLKAGYKGLTAWQTETKADAFRKVYSETWLGRRRYLPGIRNSNWNVKSFAERCALNTPIQGTAADILKIAICRILIGLPDRPWLKPILQIHDELTFIIPKDKLSEAVYFIKACMETQPFPEFDLPLVAEASAGESFGTMEELEDF